MANSAECLVWHTSTRCDTNACVEVAVDEDRVLLRHSEDPDGPVLTFTHAEWTAFIESLKDPQ